MFNLDRDAMKDLKAIRLLSLLTALGLLYVGIDRVFFDRIVGGDPLSTIQRILAIVIGTLLCAVSVSLFVVAWRGRFPLTAKNTNSITQKLLAYPFCAAPSAFVFGAFQVRTIKYSNILDFTVVVLSAASLMFVLFWTRRAVRRLATGEIANQRASQFLWSCIFFSMFSFMFGMAVSGYVWFSTDFLRKFGLVFWTAMMAVAIYPVRRDAKRLADALTSNNITSVQRDQGNE
jgi:cell division protein FtsL